MVWLTWSLIIESIAMGVALAMDAFSISLTNGLNEPDMKKSRMLLIAGTFAGFQIMMPLIGWICVHTIATQFEAFTAWIPWIALALLGYIGGKMLIEGIGSIRRKNRESVVKAEPADAVKSAGGNGMQAQECVAGAVTIGALMVQGIATSIDALSTGFTIAEYGFAAAFTESVIIGIVTFIICIFGVLAGRKIGTKLSDKASILGGTILVIIGLKIFLEGIL